jgi:DNA (cytosine-5)-methyltransferase 1
MREPNRILNNAYKEALKETGKDKGEPFLSKLTQNQKTWLKNIADKSRSQKAVVAVITTSFVKKIESPEQDVRLHRATFEGGYSARGLDTRYITPFFKEKFHWLAMKESGWLTRSIEQDHPFNLDFPGMIRNREVKESLLQILNDVDVERNKASPKTYLTALFILLIQKAPAIREVIKAEFIPTLPISLMVECLSSHFFQKYSVGGAASLPVIAIYSIYEILMRDVSRYQDKTLRPLRSLYSPDLRVGLGDIEILDESNEYFECVEIKHEIPIEAIMIEDAYEKFKNTSVKRYFLLSTAKPFIKSGEEEKIKNSIEKVREEHGCEVIVNGIIPSLKYYLRLLANPGELMSGYTNNLISRFSETAEIKEEHINSMENNL